MNFKISTYYILVIYILRRSTQTWTITIDIRGIVSLTLDTITFLIYLECARAMIIVSLEMSTRLLSWRYLTTALFNSTDKISGLSASYDFEPHIKFKKRTRSMPCIAELCQTKSSSYKRRLAVWQYVKMHRLLSSAYHKLKVWKFKEVQVK